MDQPDPSYEVILALDTLLSAEALRRFRWSWILVGTDGLVTVRGKVYATMRAAIDAAAEYRRSHGGGEIRVNLQDTRHQDPPGAIYLS